MWGFSFVLWPDIWFEYADEMLKNPSEQKTILFTTFLFFHITNIIKFFSKEDNNMNSCNRGGSE